MELGLTHANGFTQTGAYLRDTRVDRATIRCFQYQRQETVIQLSQVPPGILAHGVAGLHRQAQNRRAHDLIGEFGRDDLRDVGNSIYVDDGHCNRLLAERRQRHRLLEAPQEPPPIELRPGALIGRSERAVLRASQHGSNDADSAVGTLGADPRLVISSTVLKPGLCSRSKSDGFARELLEEPSYGVGPNGLYGLAD